MVGCAAKIPSGSVMPGRRAREEASFTEGGLMKLKLAGLAVGVLLLFSNAHAATLEWVRQLGTDTDDVVIHVSADGFGNVYISGGTAGSLGGPNAGQFDAFLSKFDGTGNSLWSRQFGTTEYDQANDVAADGLGNVYITGYTTGNLGGPNAGNLDAFLSKYDAGGTALWTRQLGTIEDDVGYGVAADTLGNTYITGYTWGDLAAPGLGGLDAFLRKYDASGNVLWTNQFGTSFRDEGRGVALDDLGNLYVTGFIEGFAGKRDAFLNKYDTDGNLQWTRQLTTEDQDISFDVFADALGNVFITGRTDVIQGDYNAFVSNFDASGNLQWIRQIGTSKPDLSFGVSADGLGNAYISGHTSGSLGALNAGSGDAFVSKFDVSGNLLGTGQLGTSDADGSEGVSVDGFGNVYISGRTSGSLGGANAGATDAFVAKYSNLDVPEPSSLVLASFVAIFAPLLRLRPQ